MALTTDEALRLRSIKVLTQQGRRDLVSREEKQWTLDMMRREQLPMTAAAIAAAAKEGYDVSGLRVAA